MADSIAGSWASLAGIEIVNDARTLAYLENGLGPSSLNVRGDCGCPNIVDLLNCPGVTGYDSPATDDAPWYTADIPESAGFLGFITDEFDGMQSTFDRKVTQAVGNGGVLNRSRLATRELTWRGYLFGTTCCSVQYGLRWLTKTLSRFDTSCKDCFGDDLELLVCCPDEDEAATGSSSPFRLLKGVGLIEGPTILSQRKTCTSNCSARCGGSCILEVEFTLVATQPYFYSPEIPMYDCVSFSNGVAAVTDPEVPCGPFDCSDALFETGPCALPELPPTATYINLCAQSITGFGPAVYLTVPREMWNDLEEVVPVISIENNSGFAFTAVRLGFYLSSNGDPCGDLLNNPPNCDAICDELTIFSIPGASTFYIDGRTRKMALICDNNNTAFPGERHTSGPWSWPTFSSHGFCLELQFIDEVNKNDVCVSLSLVPRSF